VQAVLDLDKAFTNFFDRRAAYPKPRRKYRNESFRLLDPKQFRIEENRIFLPKAGWVEMVMHREIVDRGSKHEHETVVLKADDGETYILRQQGSLAFGDTSLAALVGTSITAKGFALDESFIVQEWRSLE
jgi:hypothetical protein